MRILLMIAVIVMAPLFGTAFGITRDLTSYTIQRVWSDPASVYVVYMLHRAAVDGSLSDIHGTVKLQTQELRLTRVSKKALAKSGQITLGEGDTGTTLIYQDSDFELARIKEVEHRVLEHLGPDLQSGEGSLGQAADNSIGD